MVPNVVESREGWELYIVTDGVMVGILLGEGWELYIVTDGVMFGIERTSPGQNSIHKHV
jgi:hypothetical protein